jgi:hypothetical protein
VEVAIAKVGRSPSAFRGEVVDDVRVVVMAAVVEAEQEEEDEEEQQQEEQEQQEEPAEDADALAAQVAALRGRRDAAAAREDNRWGDKPTGRFVQVWAAEEAAAASAPGGGAIATAQERWAVTKEWRQAEGVATVLLDPQPHFDAIKTYFPHCFHGWGKAGGDKGGDKGGAKCPIYYEQLGAVNFEELEKAGVGVEQVGQEESISWAYCFHLERECVSVRVLISLAVQMLAHYVFLSEYIWNVLMPFPDEARLITVLDVKGIKFKVKR